MNILLNGEALQTEAKTLEAMLTETGYRDAVVATAVNGDFVPQTLRATTTLADGDRVEVLAPMQGG